MIRTVRCSALSWGAGNISSPRSDGVTSERSTLEAEAFEEPDLGEPLSHEEAGSIVPEPSVHEDVFTPGPYRQKARNRQWWFSLRANVSALKAEVLAVRTVAKEPNTMRRFGPEPGALSTEAAMEHSHKFPCYAREGGALALEARGPYLFELHPS